MKKYDKSLEQVWKWKDSIYNRVKGMAIRKQLEFISKEAKKVEERSRLRLKKVSGYSVPVHNL